MRFAGGQGQAARGDQDGAMNPGPGWANGITITVSAPLTRLPRTYLQLQNPDARSGSQEMPLTRSKTASREAAATSQSATSKPTGA